MKLNNKGFAISSILYIILIMAVILVSLTLTILTSRKLIIDKLRKETLNNIYDRFDISYGKVLNTLKEEIISYATDNDITKESIKIGDFNTSISEELINAYKLDTKYLTVESKNSNYNVYLGKKETITGNNKEVKDLVDIIDYKIEGNSYQDLSSGSPSPSDPIEVYSVGDKITDDTNSNYGKYNIPIRTGNKNLLDKNESLLEAVKTETKTVGWATNIFDNEWIVNNLKPSTIYTLSYDLECIDVPEYDTGFSKNIGLYIYSGVSGYSAPYSLKQKYLNEGEKVHFTHTFTTPSNFLDEEANYNIKFYTNGYLKDEKAVHSEMIISNIQLELGNEETIYRPYTTPYTTNIYLDNPLRKVENKIDSMSLSNSNIKRNVGIAISKSTDNFYYTNQGLITNNLYRSMLGFKDASNYMVSGSNVPGYSNVLPSNKQRWNKWTEEQVHFGQANNAIYLIFNEEQPTLEDAYNYLSSNGTVEPYFIYQLNAEQTEEVSLPKINTSIGTQTISVDTDIEPSNVEFTVINKIKQL